MILMRIITIVLKEHTFGRHACFFLFVCLIAFAREQSLDASEVSRPK